MFLSVSGMASAMLRSSSTDSAVDGGCGCHGDPDGPAGLDVVGGEGDGSPAGVFGLRGEQTP